MGTCAYAQLNSSLSDSNKSPASDRKLRAALIRDWKTQTTVPLGSRQKLQVMMIKQRASSLELWNAYKASPTDLCVLILSVYRVSYSCAHGGAKIRFLCAPAGQFQQHCHCRHFCRVRWTGKLRRSTCHLLNSPQHLRRAAALGVSPRLLPQLRERQVSVRNCVMLIFISVWVRLCVKVQGSWHSLL